MGEMTLSNNLQQLMRIHGNISISELARLTDIPQPTIHHILTGSTKNPRKRALEALSEYFSVSIQQLLGQEQLPTVIPDAVKEDLHISTIPIVEWEMLQEWPSTMAQASRQILLDRKIAKNSFALVSKNIDLEPAIPQNALLIFEADKSPKDRDFVVVHLGRENLILLNSLFIENGQHYVKQNQEDGNVRLIKLDTAQDRILGTLIEARIVY